MTQSVTGAIAQLASLIGDISGIRSAPTEPPEKITAFPFAVTYAGAGTWTKPPAAHEYSGELVLELHVARKNLPRSTEQLMAYVQSIPEAIGENPTLNGAIMTVEFPIKFSGLTQMEYAGVETLGFVWRIPVKVRVLESS